jgi:HEXXH motif-containing protein
LRVVTLDDRQLGQGQTARYRRLVDDDQEVGLALTALEGAAFARAAQRLNDALALLDAGVPELAQELRTLVHEVIVVDKPGHWPFGASSFQLWGALFLKLAPEASRVEIAEALAHESAHALLFGFSMGRPLVENEPDELYPSPLRSDPRPMDGVVHATYVIARMHYTGMRLLESGLLTEAEATEARALIERDRRGYAQGVAVVDCDARWTEPGQAALSSAKAYMTAQLRS